MGQYVKTIVNFSKNKTWSVSEITSFQITIPIL